MFANKDIKISKEKFTKQVEETIGIGRNENGVYDIETNEPMQAASFEFRKSNGDTIEYSSIDYGTKKHATYRLKKPNGEYSYIDSYWEDGVIDWVQAFSTHDGLAATVSMSKRYASYAVNGKLGDNNIRRYISAYDDRNGV